MRDQQPRLIQPNPTEHNPGTSILRSRAPRSGEPTIEGDRWWPHDSWRCADLYQDGAILTSYERWLAERELTRRIHRRSMPPVISKESVVFEQTRQAGVSIGYIVAPNLNHEAPSHTVEMLRIAPGHRTLELREHESVVHIIAGNGHSTIFGQRFDWTAHDSLHVAEGAWYQHVNDGDTTAEMLIGRATPLLEQLYLMPTIYKGDEFSDLPDDYKPEHPFTGQRVQVGYVGGKKWMSNMQRSHHEERDVSEAESRDGRKIMKSGDATIERSHHRGDWKVGLIDPFLGFANKILGLYVHQLPPKCHTETHQHGWATVYVLGGHGYSIVDGEHCTWRAGDMINVPAGAWHQHFNDDETLVSQHLVVSAQPLQYALGLAAGSVEERSVVSQAL